MIQFDSGAMQDELFELAQLKFAQKFEFLPYSLVGDTLNVGLVDDTNQDTRDRVARRLGGYQVEFFAISPAQLNQGFARWERWERSNQTVEAVETIVGDSLTADAAAAAAAAAGSEEQESRVGNVLRQLVLDAYKKRASDIHVEPVEGYVVIRFRIDGTLQEAHKFVDRNSQLSSALINRIKIDGGMRVEERRIPQDGRITFKEQNLELRTAIVPLVNEREMAVLRLLDAGRTATSVGDLGFSKPVVTRFLEAIDVPHGLIVICGPTGSGKTSTLAGVMASLVGVELKVISVEDPVEYRIPGVQQVQVNELAGLTFATALRSFLRSNPDVLLVGEMRDTETAKLGVQAALTGHLVFSTLHTNDSAGAAPRLNDMGVEPYLLAACLRAVLSQRLVRRLCTSCRVEIDSDYTHLSRAGWPASLAIPEHLYRVSEHGCPECEKTGWIGRFPISELIVVDQNLSDAIAANRPASDLRIMAKSQGTEPMRIDGFSRVAAGETTVEEVLRSTF